MRITKVYTKGGDKGETSLVGGKRVSKAHSRINAYGAVDELNAIIGLIRCFLAKSTASEQSRDDMDGILNRIQNELFVVGADLATPVDSRWENMVRISNAEIIKLEEDIDRLNDELPPLEEFILPGGGPVGAFFHQARTDFRRRSV